MAYTALDTSLLAPGKFATSQQALAFYNNAIAIAAADDSGATAPRIMCRASGTSAIESDGSTGQVLTVTGSTGPGGSKIVRPQSLSIPDVTIVDETVLGLSGDSYTWNGAFSMECLLRRIGQVSVKIQVGPYDVFVNLPFLGGKFTGNWLPGSSTTTNLFDSTYNTSTLPTDWTSGSGVGAKYVFTDVAGYTGYHVDVYVRAESSALHVEITSPASEELQELRLNYIEY